MSCRRPGSASAATGTRAAASPSTCSTRAASPPPASGSRRRRCSPTVAEADTTFDAEAAKAEIRKAALALGFDTVGFTEAHLPDEARERLDRFLLDGMQGEMAWMWNRAEQRGHPRSLWPEAVSAVCLGLSYAPKGDPLAALAHRDR